MRLSNILFLDIETVSIKPKFEDLPEDVQELWEKKSKYWKSEAEEQSIAEIFSDKAGIFAEFAKIVCISVGYINDSEDKRQIKLKSFYNDDEKVILQDFSNLINNHFNNPNLHSLCGHNIKEFDIPFICRRMIINDITLPIILNVMGKKPWETKHLLDTMEMWKFGDYKNFTSLNLLANVLGIKSPKDDIDGSMVGKVYWEEGNLERIKIYCEKDVRTVAQVYLRMNNHNQLDEEE